MDWLVWGYKQFFCCKRRVMKLFYEDKPVERLVHIDQLPWLWIGLVNSVGQTIAVTQLVNDCIKPGMRITPEFLYRLIGTDTGVWHYIDSKTLEDKVFPSEGFIIEDGLPHAK